VEPNTESPVAVIVTAFHLGDDVNHHAVVRRLMRDLYVVVVSGDGGQHVSNPASQSLCYEVREQLKRHYVGLYVEVWPADHPDVKHGQYCK